MYKDGRIPLHTLRADVDYALSEALTTYGLIGIVWICKGEVFGKRDLSPNFGMSNRKPNNDKRKIIRILCYNLRRRNIESSKKENKEMLKEGIKSLLVF